MIWLCVAALVYGVNMALNRGCLVAASERRGNNLKGFTDVYLKAKALTVLYVPCSLDSGSGDIAESRRGEQTNDIIIINFLFITPTCNVKPEMVSRRMTWG